VLSQTLLKLTSVTRWLIVVVIGCTVLETVQPMNAAESDPATDARSADTMLYPKNAPDAVTTAAPSDGSGRSLLVVGAFLLALGGGWLLLRRRGLPLSRVAGVKRALLRVEETKSLGNRQYLVVAGCEGRRFLLGVTPGRIQLLSPLDDAEDAVVPETES
jgi:flagellar protein FliO/FliZ